MARPNTLRGGRPRTREGDLKTQRITAWCSASEYLRLSRAAEAAGLPLGAWLILRGLEHAPSILEDRGAVETVSARHAMATAMDGSG